MESARKERFTGLGRVVAAVRREERGGAGRAAAGSGGQR
jgi:hypothetical protein